MGEKDTFNKVQTEQENTAMVANSDSTGNPLPRGVKDSAFCIAYNDKEAAASLVSELLGTECTADDIEIVTLNNDGVLGRHNDLGVLLSDDSLLIFVEEQSSECPNMPLRLLLYYARAMQNYISLRRLGAALYSGRLVRIPEPVFYVVSTDDRGAGIYELKDAFKENHYNMMNLSVRVIRKSDSEVRQSLNPFYLLADYVERNKGRDDYDQMRGEIIKMISECDCPESVKKAFLGRSEKIMGAMLQEITYEDIMRVNIEEAKKQVTQQVTQQVTKQVTQQVKKQGIKILYTSLVGSGIEPKKAADATMKGYDIDQEEFDRIIKEEGSVADKS